MISTVSELGFVGRPANQVSTCLANSGLNILDMLNQSRGDVAYTLVDLDREVPEETYKQIASIDGVLAARVI